jgi:TM2 domain-containing membrane protein YozV
MAAGMSDEQQAAFYAQMAVCEKDEVAGVLLALFLGSFGLHHFYLRRTGLGVLYLCFFWTGIPGFLGFIECFFMPSRVQRYNLEQASMVAATIRGAFVQAQPAITRRCAVCGAELAPGVRFCGKCGAGIS